MRVLVSGGAGYIGSHACVALAAAGHEVAVLDSFVNSTPAVLRRITELVGTDVPVYRLDVRDRAAVARSLADWRAEAVVHFAALKSPSESFGQPLDYFDVNVGGTIALLGAMADADVRYLVFSSSATVYGEPDTNPVPESAELRPNNPYATSKVAAERIIEAIAASRKGFVAATLRYFNPAGAHPSGRLGEMPQKLPNNLFPYVAEVASGRRTHVSVFGGDWPTPDGTGVRDYIHVMDLARAHAMALAALAVRGHGFTVNLGAGRGASVLDVVHAFERASGRAIPYRIVARRPGDLGEVLADPARAEALFGWTAQHTLDDICRDAWRWQRDNPDGLADAT